MTGARTLTAATLAAMVLGTFPAALAQSFPDVKASYQYKEAIDSLRADGVIAGNPDGTYRPDATINRAEFLKIVLESRGEIDASAGECFPDVEDEWFAPYVCTAKTEDIVQGYSDGSFRPEQAVNFVEAAKILSLAYGQPITQWAPDWYEPYARAIESGNAIPPTIAKLDAPLTRGEMAEMMWRLTGNITDRDTKGYLNVKYPDVGVNMASDEPQQAKACADLRAFAEEAGRSGYGGGMDYMEDSVGAPVPMMGAPAMNREADGASLQKATEPSPSYSDTNVQVAGVDEADIVKTDGTYLYAVIDGVVRIIEANPASRMKERSALRFKDGFNPTDLYVMGDTMVVTGSRWNQYEVMPMSKMMPSIWPGPYWNPQHSEIRVYDVSDRDEPELTRTVSFEGYIVSTRRIDDRLYLVFNQQIRPWGGPIPLGVTEANLLPTYSDSANDVVDQPVARCSSVTILPNIPSPQYLTVATFSLADNDAEVDRSVVLGSAENVYASLQNLYTAATEYRYSWDGKNNDGPSQLTHLYRFAFTDDGIEMRAKGSVDGRILDQFSMDEHENSFRIATTEDGMWKGSTTDPSSNNLFVLNMDLDVVGKIEDIAPGEQIYSTRFLGDRTYMVTFKKIDPFFVIDTSDPRNPRILGKLKIPGYSDYLHPYDEDHVIGFGKEAVESKDGDFAWYQGMKIAVFDVSDVASPQELHKIVIGDRGTDSPLLYDHKALLFDRERNLLAFPISIAKISDTQKQEGDPGMTWGEQVFQGAQVYDLSLSRGFKLRGSITHYDDEDRLKAGGYLYGKDVLRIVRLDDSLLTLSSEGVQSHTEDDVTLEKGISFQAVTADGGVCPSEDDGATYVSHDPNECALLRFSCVEGMEGFNDSCGCGCRPN